MSTTVRYAIVLLGDEDLFGYIECEPLPTFDMLLDAFEGEQTRSMLHEVRERLSFHALH